MMMMSPAVALVSRALFFGVQISARAGWGFIALSALLHVGCNLFLVRTYRSGDLGQTYPIARGSSPLLVAPGAALFARDIADARGETWIFDGSPALSPKPAPLTRPRPCP